MRWIVRGVLFAALVAGVFVVLPRLGGLRHDAASLRHARPAFVVVAVVAQAVSLGCYALLYRRVLTSLGARLRFRVAADVTLASFLVSHVTPFGSATGTLLNVSALEEEGIPASTTGEAIGLTTLVSTVALIALFGTGLVATAGRHVSATYLKIAGIALVLVVLVLAVALVVGAHPGIAERAARRVAGWARHVRRSIDPDKVAQTSGRLVRLARSALTGRAFAESYGFASADLLFDLLSLDLMFLAFRYQPGFGPLAVAYAAANIASAIPVTPGGLGVIEVTLVAITVGFGAPRATAVVAVLGLPGHQLLAPAAARGRGLPSPPAEPEGGGQGEVPGAACRMTRACPPRVASPVRPGLAMTVMEVPMEDLRYKMIMALNAADIGNPICEQAAQICAEIAEQYCAQLHVTTTARVVAAGQRAGGGPAPRVHEAL
jgi:uncharacterized protein (TIRG00374 family)